MNGQVGSIHTEDLTRSGYKDLQSTGPVCSPRGISVDHRDVQEAHRCPDTSREWGEEAAARPPLG